MNASPQVPIYTSVPTADLPPVGYNYVGLDVGNHTDGFTIVPGVRDLVQSNKTFRGFAACYVDGIAPYWSVGPEIELLWRNASARAPSPRCADVELKVIPV